jgi:hypothetical protein
MMFDAIVKENEIEIPQKDVDFIKGIPLGLKPIALCQFSDFCLSDLIQGKDRHPENKEKSFLFQIVANKANGVDVDK